MDTGLIADTYAARRAETNKSGVNGCDALKMVGRPDREKGDRKGDGRGEKRGGEAEGGSMRDAPQ